jgi:hypothetical protein
MSIVRAIVLAGCIAWPLASVLAQADPKLCAEIPEDQARLKCFDALFPSVAVEADWRHQPITPRRVKTERITADAPQAPEPGSVLERLIGAQ